MSPGLALGLLMVLIGAQVTRVASHGVRFAWALLLGAAGFVLGELFAIATHFGGPLLAGLHPVADGAAIALAELGGALLAPRRRAP